MLENSASSTIRSVVEQFVREELSQENAQIAGAVWAMLDAGGKGLRPRITMLAALSCDPDAALDPVLASYMELIPVAAIQPTACTVTGSQCWPATISSPGCSKRSPKATKTLCRRSSLRCCPRFVTVR